MIKTGRQNHKEEWKPVDQGKAEQNLVGEVPVPEGNPSQEE